MELESRMAKLLVRALENGSARRGEDLEIKAEGNHVFCTYRGVNIAIWQRDTGWIICDSHDCKADYRTLRRNTGQFVRAVWKYRVATGEVRCPEPRSPISYVTETEQPIASPPSH